MKSTELQAIRREILDQLYAVRSDALAPERMLKNMRTQGGFAEVTKGDVIREADYLADKKNEHGQTFVEKVRDPVAPGAFRYRLTAAGIEHVELELG